MFDQHILLWKAPNTPPHCFLLLENTWQISDLEDLNKKHIRETVVLRALFSLINSLWLSKFILGLQAIFKQNVMTELIPRMWGKFFCLLSCHFKLNQCQQRILRQINFPLNVFFPLIHLHLFPWILSVCADKLDTHEWRKLLTTPPQKTQNKKKGSLGESWSWSK